MSEDPKLKKITPRLVMEVLSLLELDELAQMASPLYNSFLRAGVMKSTQMIVDSDVSEMNIKPDAETARRFLTMVLENPEKIGKADFSTVREVKDIFFMKSWSSMIKPIAEASNMDVLLTAQRKPNQETTKNPKLSQDESK